jgi:hypothetical protein
MKCHDKINQIIKKIQDLSNLLFDVRYMFRDKVILSYTLEKKKIQKTK